MELHAIYYVDDDIRFKIDVWQSFELTDSKMLFDMASWNARCKFCDQLLSYS